MDYSIIEKILKQENIKCTTITKSNTGFTNQVFFIDDKYVIKLCGEHTKPKKLENEIAFYNNVKLDCIPKYVADGNVGNTRYLIIEKLKGHSLFNIWHTLDNTTRNNIVTKICDILNQFHSCDYRYLSSQLIDDNWLEIMNRRFDKNIDVLSKRGFDTQFMLDFKQHQLENIFTQQKMCLIYNDAHFDNFIYNDGEVKLIDFDRVKYATIDYELLIIKQMLDNPMKFAGEEDEPNVKITDYDGIYETIKKLCPDMFNFKFIDDRVFVYQFLYNLGNAYEYDRNNWIEEEITKFKNHFNL